MGICKQCKQLFYGGLLKYRVIEENNRHMIIYFFYNSIIRRGPRACARAREIKIYILIIWAGKAFVYL